MYSYAETLNRLNVSDDLRKYLSKYTSEVNLRRLLQLQEKGVPITQKLAEFGMEQLNDPKIVWLQQNRPLDLQDYIMTLNDYSISPFFGGRYDTHDERLHDLQELGKKLGIDLVIDETID